MHQKYKLSEQFPQKRALIINAGSALGRALAVELGGDGWIVGMIDTDTVAMEEISQTVNESGGRAISYQLEVSQIAQFEGIAKSFLSETGGIDLLINNIGINEKSSLGDHSIDKWVELININQMNVLYGCHFFIAVMLSQATKGHIINIASSTQVSDPATMAPYTMTKAAVIALSDTIRAKFKNHNIKVSLALPALHKVRKMQPVGEATVSPTPLSSIEHKKTAQEILEKAGQEEFYIFIPWYAQMILKAKEIFIS